MPQEPFNNSYLSTDEEFQSSTTASAAVMLVGIFNSQLGKKG